LLDGGGPDGTASSVPVPATLELAEDGSFSADTGCNTLSGTYTAEGTTLLFEPGARTDAGCPDGPEQALEDHVGAVFTDPSVTGTIEADTLTVSTSRGAGLVYRVAEGS